MPAAALALALALLAGGAAAQPAYPHKSVTLVTHSSPCLWLTFAKALGVALPGMNTGHGGRGWDGQNQYDRTDFKAGRAGHFLGFARRAFDAPLELSAYR